MAEVLWQVPTGVIQTLSQGDEISQGDDLFTYYAITDQGTNVDRYELIGGRTPAGILINGELPVRGNLDAYYITNPGGDTLAVTLNGTISRISNTTTSLYVIRAWSEQDYADATFGITVDVLPPDWVTEQGNLANILTGNDPTTSITSFNTSIEYYEPKTNANVAVSLVGGNVPPGMVLDTSAAIAQVNPAGYGTVPIYNVPYYPNDYANAYTVGANANTFVKNYSFTLNLDDNYSNSNATFAINIYAREYLSADRNITYSTANAPYYTFDASSDYLQPDYPTGYPVDDYTFPPYTNPTGNFKFSADDSSKYGPWLTTPAGIIGNTVTTDFFASKIGVFDPSGATVSYQLEQLNPDGSPSVLPLGLQLDPVTGYIWGNSRSDFNTDFTFTIYAYEPTPLNANNQPFYQSKSVTYTLRIYSRNPTNIIWNTAPDLGRINNGTVSELSISASLINDQLYYEHVRGYLPPGLILQESGLIVGTVIFDTPSPAQTYSFTVEARGVTSGKTSTQEFILTVDHFYTTPFNNIYMQSYSRSPSRNVISSILTNYNAMPINEIYRFGDSNFGISRSCKFLHALNLRVATDDQYAQAMSKNHYRKNLFIGPFQNALARNANGSIRYEVVYCKIIDDLTNAQGLGPPQTEVWPFPIQEGNTTITEVYPNTLADMRARLYNDVNIGQVNNELPLWMSSAQADKQVLGYTPAWVICYALPGYGDAIAFRLNQAYGKELYKIDFDVDRYDLDNKLTYRYNPVTETWNNPTNLLSVADVELSSDNIITLDITGDSTAIYLNPGDTLSWSSTYDPELTTTVIDVGAYTPVYNLVLGNAGNGYSTVLPPEVSIDLPIQGGGVRARATASVLSNGRLDPTFTILSTGFGYHLPPTVTIQPPPNGNVGNTATATAEIKVSPIAGVTIDYPGSNYTTIPILTVQPPSFDPVIPNFNITDSTAQIEVGSLNISGEIESLTITNYGTNYTSAPAVISSYNATGNVANISTTINYQVVVGKPEAWTNGSVSNTYLFNKYAQGDELNKYYLFPRVNILE